MRPVTEAAEPRPSCTKTDSVIRTVVRITHRNVNVPTAAHLWFIDWCRFQLYTAESCDVSCTSWARLMGDDVERYIIHSSSNRGGSWKGGLLPTGPGLSILRHVGRQRSRSAREDGESRSDQTDCGAAIALA